MSQTYGSETRKNLFHKQSVLFYGHPGSHPWSLKSTQNHYLKKSFRHNWKRYRMETKRNRNKICFCKIDEQEISIIWRKFFKSVPCRLIKNGSNVSVWCGAPVYFLRKTQNEIFTIAFYSRFAAEFLSISNLSWHLLAFDV